MTRDGWYRSSHPLAADRWPAPSPSRRLRNAARALLPEPDVRRKTMVLYARQGFTKSRAWAGLFSEFHSVLGALAYAERHAAAAIRVDFRSELYVDRERGPNWWTYFFADAEMPIGTDGSRGDVHLTRRLAKFGHYGGFCDVVNGTTPYLYPMTYGLSRSEVHRLLTTYVRVRPEICEEVARVASTAFAPGVFVIGVHYRGTDSTRTMFARLVDSKVERTPYEAYAAEVRRVLAASGRADCRLLVASDEADFVDYARREFGPERVVCLEDAPRAKAGGTAVHFDRSLGASNYEKGKAALVDCLLLAASHYLIKGRSNLSDASLVFNPSLPYSFCLR